MCPTPLREHMHARQNQFRLLHFYSSINVFVTGRTVAQFGVTIIANDPSHAVGGGVKVTDL